MENEERSKIHNNNYLDISEISNNLDQKSHSKLNQNSKNMGKNNSFETIVTDQKPMMINIPVRMISSSSKNHRNDNFIPTSTIF